MARTSTSHWPCSIARTVDLLGDSWMLLILRECFYGARRFDQFVAHLGINRATLTDRLNALVDLGVLTTETYSEHPPRVEYRLTEMGRDTLPILAAIMRWGDDWLAGKEGPPVELLDPDTGRPIRPLVVDANTGKPVPHRVRVRPRTAEAKKEARERAAVPNAPRRR
jgi:DNA-binding HxlR family transcriptional regulator